MALLDDIFPGATPQPDATADPLVLQEIIRRALANAGDMVGGSTPALVGSSPAPSEPVAAPRPVPAAIPAPAPRQAPQRASQPEDSGMRRLGAMLQGFGDRGQGLIGRIGGVLSAGANYDRAQDTENLTMRALVGRGVDRETAMLIARSPEVAKAVLPSLLGATKDWEIGEIYDPETGQPQKVMWRKSDPSKMVKIGGVKQDQGSATLTREQSKEAVNRVGKYAAEAQEAERGLAELAQLRQARKGVSYAGGVAPELRTWLGKVLPDSPIPGVGLPFIPSREEASSAEAASAISENVRLGFVGRTKGAVSNREMEIFGAATPGLAMTDAGAETVMNGMEAGLLRAKERAKFFENWLARNRNLTGAQEAWDRFINENPILDTDGKGGIRVNRANIANWQAYLDGSEPPARSAPAGARQPSETRQGQLRKDDAALNRARQAIAQGAPRDAVIQRLRENGIDPAGL